MGQKLVTTNLRNMPISFLLDEQDKALEIHPFPEDLKSLVGNIYAGRVEHVVKNINAAFVHIGEDKPAYLSLDNTEKIFFADGRPRDQRPKQGDIILVQVVKDAHKTKAPKLAAEFALTGQYAVLTTNRPSIGLSSKIIGQKDRNRLKKLLAPHLTKDYGFIARTNCVAAEDEAIREEIAALVEAYGKVLSQLPYANAGSCLHRGLNGHLKLLRDLNLSQVDAYIYDDKELYGQASALVDGARLHEDSYPLAALYNLDKQLERALREKVWLKSGASIVIQPTEALVAIDVNTEKNQSRKQPDQVILATNLEAADEIARQIRLRNLTGIIIADFIDMASEEHKDQLCRKVASLCLKDRVKTRFIDMTPLGLVEITRKKMEKTLQEKLAETAASERMWEDG